MAHLTAPKRRGKAKASGSTGSEQSKIATKALALAASALKQLGRSMSTELDDDCVSSVTSKPTGSAVDERFCLFSQPAFNEAPFHRLAVRWGDKDQFACNVGQASGTIMNMCF